MRLDRRGVGVAGLMDGSKNIGVEAKARKGIAVQKKGCRGFSASAR